MSLIENNVEVVENSVEDIVVDVEGSDGNQTFLSVHIVKLSACNINLGVSVYRAVIQYT